MKNAMTLLSFAALAALCGCATSQPPAPKPQPRPNAPASLDLTGYVLNEKFSDEFDNGFDSSRWLDFYPTWNGRMGVYHFDRKNVSVRDGNLILTARAPKPEDVSPEIKAEGKERFSTGAIRSKERVLYGYFEARFISMNTCVCNSFWLNDPIDPPAKYRPGNKIEEIDIFELCGKAGKLKKGANSIQNDRIYFTTTHVADTPYVESKVWLGRKIEAGRHVVNESFSKRYHTGALLWTPTKLVWILDGKIVEERPNKDFHRPLYLNANCEVMKPWLGEPPASDLPAEYKIDYIRVWQKN
ncbi:MAG: family 16 glycosylhydrolase [Opitutales bacterium]|nr:family 16 glycosylhydrolase [Opitutales bacterium]